MLSINDWLPVVAAIASVLSALIVWGFASGKFVQKHTDDADTLRRQQAAVSDQVAINARSIGDIKDALFKLRENINRDFGRLQHKADLLEERVSVQKDHGDERHERVSEGLDKLETMVSDLQRQIDFLHRGNGTDGHDLPDRRRR